MIAALVWGGVASAAPSTYTLDPAQSHLYVIIRNDTSTVASGLGHDHAIVATTFDGTVTWDPEDPSACRIEIGFPVSALAVDPPGYRDRAALDPDGAVDEDAKKQIKKNFQKPSQLNADRYPRIEYRSTSCAPSDQAGRFDVTGKLEIRGVGQSITVPMKIDAGSGSFAAQGTFTATHTDFGFKPYTNLLGALRNQNQLEFVVNVKGR